MKRIPSVSPATLFTLVVIGLAAILVAAGLSAAAPAPTRASQLHWAMARSSLEHVSSADPVRAELDLDSPDTLVQNASPLDQNPTPTNWSTSSTEVWTSFARFAADVRAGTVPGYVRVAHYDDEAWAGTPLAEQRRPGYYQRRFCDLAHANDLDCYTGPAQDLCGVLDHPAHETYARCYLDLDLAGKAARYADVVDIQAQALEPRGARAYGTFLRRAAAQAHAANPDAIVLGNLAPSPGEATVPPSALAACARAALPYVSGFYVTVNAGEGEAMVAFLRLLDA